MGLNSSICADFQPLASPAAELGQRLAGAITRALLAFLCLWGPSCYAADPVGGPDQHSLFYGVHLPQERVLSRGLTVARQLLAERRYAESLPVLVRILHAEQDAYEAPGAGSAERSSSVKTQVRTIIAGLPPDGMRAYHLEVRAEAERELATALHAGPEALRRVAARFPQTQAARLALWLLAQQAFEQQDFEGAVTCLSALREYDLTADQRTEVDQQLQIASRVRDGRPLGGLDLGGRLNTSERGDALPEVVARPSSGRDWLAIGGGPSRNPLLSQSQPHLWARWVSYAAGTPRWAALESLAPGETPLPSAASPLLVGDWVVVRGGDGLLGVARDSGKLVWRCQLPSLSEESQVGRQIRRMHGDANLLRGLIEQVNRDAVSGRVSSNGDLVFAVAGRERSRRSRTPDAWREQRGRGIGDAGGAQNQVVAVRASAQGKRVWRTAGQQSLERVFFLDCPLVVGDRLFVLGEEDQSICLFQLDPSDGRELWRQAVATVESPVYEEAMRRMVGGCLAYARGRIVCSTGAGAVVAVDPLRRTLDWVYRFPVDGGVQLGRSTPWGRRGADGWPREARRQWLWNQVQVVGDRVLVGSPESRLLHCIDLESGDRLWTNDSSRGQLLGAANGDLAVVARSDAVAGVSLSDGETRWTSRLPKGAQPAGAGAWFQGGFLLPLTGGRAVLIATDDGRFERQFTAGPEGGLGNLASDGASVYSQSYTGVARFDLPRSLQQGPRVEAELAAVGGDRDGAVTGLWEAYETNGRPDGFASLLRDLVGAAPGEDAPAALQGRVAELYRGRPLPPVLQHRVLREAVAAGDPDQVRRLVQEFCDGSVDAGLARVSGSLAVRPSRLYQAAAEAALSEREQRDLRRSLLAGAGPSGAAVINAVLPEAALPAQSHGPIPTRDARWATAQVGFDLRPRADRIRRRNGGRVTSDPREFELPIAPGTSGDAVGVERLVVSTSGQLTMLSGLGEIAAQLELQKSSPERLQRLASDGAVVAAWRGKWLYLCTGEDVVGIDAGAADPEIRWTAKRGLLQAEFRRGSQLQQRVRSAAQRELRLVGVAQAGVVVATRDVLACLDPADGQIIWVQTDLDTDGAPTADERFVYASPTARPGWRVDLATGEKVDLEVHSGEQVAVAGGLLAIIRRGEESAEFQCLDRLSGRVLFSKAYGPGLRHRARGPLLALVDAAGTLDVLELRPSGSSGIGHLLGDQLDLSGEVVSVVVERLGDRLLVGVNHAPRHAHRAAGVTPLDWNPIQTGPLFCYDLPTGERVWPSPAMVSGKAVLGRVPERSPLVLLASSVQTRDATGRYDAVRLLGLDLASGRTVFRESGPRNDRGRQYRVQLSGGEGPRMTIALDDCYVVLDALPQATPPGPPARTNAEQSQQGDLWNVGRALGRLLGEGLNDLAPPEPAPEDDD